MHTQTPNTEKYNIIANVIDLNDVSLAPSNQKYTFYEPDWYYSVKMMKFLKLQYPNMDVETLFLHAPLRDIVSGAVQNMQYWIDNGFVQWKSSQGNSNNDTQVGFLPTVFDDSSLSLANIKLSQNTFSAPLFLPVFFVVNNLRGKVTTVWNLQNVTDPNNVQNVITVKGPPFFIFRFQSIGVYSLTVTVSDSGGSQYTTSLPNWVNVLESSEYIALVETQLNARRTEAILGLE